MQRWALVLLTAFALGTLVPMPAHAQGTNPAAYLPDPADLPAGLVERPDRELPSQNLDGQTAARAFGRAGGGGDEEPILYTFVHVSPTVGEAQADFRRAVDNTAPSARVEPRSGLGDEAIGGYSPRAQSPDDRAMAVSVAFRVGRVQAYLVWTYADGPQALDPLLAVAQAMERRVRASPPQ